MQALLDFDRWLFRLINTEWTNPTSDLFFPLLRNAFFWSPIYLFLLFFTVLNFKGKGWWWCAFFLCCFALTDSISTHIFKESFQRLRPCMDALTVAEARMLIPCSGSFGFVSSHAANHFGMAMFMYGTLRIWAKKWMLLVFLWAVLVSYAQIYVGAHFPFDVLAGAILGMTIGWLASKLFKKIMGGLIVESNEFE